MPKVSPEHQEARRQQILKAAIYCFAEKGFHTTTMQEICRKAELSPGAVYLYFSGKDQLIESLMEYLHSMNKNNFETLFTDEIQKDVLLDALDSLFVDTDSDETQINQDICTRLDIMFLAEALRNDQTKLQLRKASERNAQLYYRIIKEAQEAGVIKKEWSAEVIGDLIENMYFSLSISQTFHPDRSFKEHRSALKAMIMNTFFE